MSDAFGMVTVLRLGRYEECTANPAALNLRDTYCPWVIEISSVRLRRSSPIHNSLGGSPIRLLSPSALIRRVNIGVRAQKLMLLPLFIQVCLHAAGTTHRLTALRRVRT